MPVRRSERLDGCELVWTDDRIAVVGVVDQVNAGAVAGRLCAAVAGVVTVIDLGGVTFFSAAGMHVLEAVAAAAAAADAIVQVSCSVAVWEIAEVCGATDLPGLVLDRYPRADPDEVEGRGAKP
ncbi:hypothetical protein [Dactylosporangium sp. CS-033363]|uniref:hypothetical protein n=1 Tax=Dactylosporangium sp. CS-033363 TaxID=3239935 RepID=UPI003D8E62EE